MKKFRNIAIYLPQFHPTTVNDSFWGKGCTEWTNVTKSKPRFPGHYQPKLPADLGFYDLRVPEVRKEQARMAMENGIDGFCYYHYWYKGKRLLELPFNEVLKTGEPDFPFMLCWANHDWSKSWLGNNKEIIIKQEYSDEDDANHADFLCKCFADERYIKIGGRPVFGIYRSTAVDDCKRRIDNLRKECKLRGFDIYLVRFESDGTIGADYLKPGFDAAVEFQPHCDHGYKHRTRQLVNTTNKYLQKLGLGGIPLVFSYRAYVNYIMKFPIDLGYKRFPCITPMWDNAARYTNKPFFCLHKSTPQVFQKWLESIYKKFIPYSSDENLVFFNAWNEWAEGNYLEPDRKWGHAYLNAIKKATGGI